MAKRAQRKLIRESPPETETDPNLEGVEGLEGVEDAEPETDQSEVPSQ